MEFKEELIDKVKLINNELEKYIRRENVPEEQLNQSMEYSLMAGGKRIRPTLILEVYKLFDKDIEKAMTFAVAMEMVHNFSLIHDDLPGIDNDDFRHGKPTNHKKFNEATAILAGDGLLNNAYLILSKKILEEKSDIQKQRMLRALAEFASAVDRMIAGEYVDTEFEGKEISSKYLEYIHQNKTGALIKCSARIGAILAGADEENIKIISQYADKIGLAFQIKDDILSEIGDVKKTGKPVGNDRERQKCTYVSEYGLDKSKSILNEITSEAIELLNIYGEKAEFLKKLAIYIANREK